MTERYSFAVLLQVQTTDPRLSEQAMGEALSSGRPGEFARMRRAVLQHVPKDVTRVIAMMPLTHAKMLMLLHETLGNDMGKMLQEMGMTEDDGVIFIRPPADYVPPTRD